MNDQSNNMLSQINNERKIEARHIQFEKDADNLFKEIKILHDVILKNGFDDYKATIFSNTYFGAVLSSSLSLR